MWYYVLIDFLKLSRLVCKPESDLILTFRRVSNYVFKSDFKCRKFRDYIIKEVYMKYGSFIISNHYQCDIEDCFTVITAHVVYDNYATFNKFSHMFNLIPTLPCLDVKDSSSEVQDASLVAVSAVD